MSSDHTLWIGNLDVRLTEYQIVQILKEYGKLANFEFMFFKNGPKRGMPRGYCFAEYERKENAERAMLSLNGKEIASTQWVVGWANDASDLTSNKDDHPFVWVHDQKKRKESSKQDENSLGKGTETAKERQMAALEVKLKSLEKTATPSDLSSISKHPVLARQEAHRSRSRPYKLGRRKKYFHK